MSEDLIPVPVGECRCPGTPHEDGDVVSLYPNLPMTVGMAAHSAMSVLSDGVERLTAVYRIVTEGCIADWTFVDDRGSKLPINPSTINSLLPWNKGGSEVALTATNLHASTLLAPFKTPSREEKTPTPISSRTGRTAKGSISRNPSTKSTPLEPSA
jgi:hypothetical protein